MILKRKQSFFINVLKWRHRIFVVPKIMEYKRVSRFLLEMKSMPLRNYTNNHSQWDHSPRSLNKALVLNHAEPAYFDRHVKMWMRRIENKPLEHRLAFVKSWNEWGKEIIWSRICAMEKVIWK